MRNSVVQVIVATGCAHCHEFLEFWEREHPQWPDATLLELNILSAEGQRLADSHHIFAMPGIIVEGKVLSTGAIDADVLKNKLQQLLA